MQFRMKSKDYFDNTKSIVPLKYLIFQEPKQPKSKSKYQNISQGKIKKAKLISDIIKEEFEDFSKSVNSLSFGPQSKLKAEQ